MNYIIVVQYHQFGMAYVSDISLYKKRLFI
jgi:hypothetical protein